MMVEFGIRHGPDGPTRYITTKEIERVAFLVEQMLGLWALTGRTTPEIAMKAARRAFEKIDEKKGLDLAIASQFLCAAEQSTKNAVIPWPPQRRTVELVLSAIASPDSKIRMHLGVPPE